MTFSIEFKEAIANLPPKEKDKLILRLLKKDIPLANRLAFELVSEDTADERRDRLEESIKSRIEWISKHSSNGNYLVIELREISGNINELIFVTKDKFGEVWLNLVMINEILEKNTQNLKNKSPNNTYKLYIYIIARIYKIMGLTLKLDEDLWLELREPFEKLANLLTSDPYLAKLCINNGLDFNWLANFNFPENIDQRAKDLRSKGFLR